MAINFTALKNNFYDLTVGTILVGGSLAIGYKIYKEGAIGFAAKVIKDKEILTLIACGSMYTVDNAFAINGWFRNDENKKTLVTVSMSLIPVLSLAAAVAAGYRLPAYLLTALSVLVVVDAGVLGIGESVKGLKGIANTLLGRNQQVQEG